MNLMLTVDNKKKKRQKKMGMMNYKYKSYYFISVVFKVIH